jgi:quercetin dioxygenase-like cupin family protein
MNPISETTLAAAMAFGQAEAKDQTIQVFSPGLVPATQGASEFFVGDVYVDQLYQGTAPAAISGGLVSFTPGARTAWHTHPLGQTLYVVSGVGRVQMAEGPVQGIRPGDLVWIPAGVKHWHGAAPDTPMTHLALAERQDGQVVTWLAQVSERDYRTSVAGGRN